MKNAFRTLFALMCMLAVLCFGFAMAEAVPEPTAEPTETATPIPTPSAEDLGELVFRIDGPDASMPMTVKYSDFAEKGKYVLEGLVPGTYTVTEVDPDKLLENLNYTFDEENSVTQLTIEVKAETANAETTSEPTLEPIPAEGQEPIPAEGQEKGNVLKNIYERTVEVTPTPSPEPSPSEEPSPTPTPEPPEELVTIPVVKIWEDFGNRDQNRPDRVFVNLLADGTQVTQAVLNAANGWSWQFTDLPKTRDGKEIVYTVTEEPVEMYVARIDGYTITNIYSPVTTSVTVSKVWVDNNNSAGLRPLSIYCTLSNGIHVELTEKNNWTATVDNLPTIVNGREVIYTWSEQEIVQYSRTGEETVGNTTVFTNSLIERKRDNPPEGKTPPKRGRGNNYLIIEDYGTPLGVDVVINHVGDCFD